MIAIISDIHISIWCVVHQAFQDAGWYIIVKQIEVKVDLKRHFNLNL